MKKVKYGIVSTAQVVPRFIDGVRLTDNGEVAAVSSRTLEAAQAFAMKHNIPKAYGSHAELYADPELDVIYIATYNKGHFPEAKQAYWRENVLLEKAVYADFSWSRGTFWAGAWEKSIFDEAQKSVFLPVTQMVKEVVQSDEIGDILAVDSVTAYASIDHISWFNDLESGGGTVHFMLPYAISYLQYIFDAKIIDFSGIADMQSGESDTQAKVLLKLDNGVLINIFLTTKVGLDKVMTIKGQKENSLFQNFGVLKLQSSDLQMAASNANLTLILRVILSTKFNTLMSLSFQENVSVRRWQKRWHCRVLRLWMVYINLGK